MGKITFVPIEWKYRKFHNNIIMNKLKKKETKHFLLKKGNLGLKSLYSDIIDSKQLLSCLKILTRICKKEFKFWFYCFPNISITGKGISVRMGTGIGAIINWIYIIKKNAIFLELVAFSHDLVLFALKKARRKLKIENKIIKKNIIIKKKKYAKKGLIKRMNKV